MLLEHYRSKTAAADFDAFVAYLVSAAEAFAAELALLPPGEARARALYRRVDQETEAAGKIPASCKKGCAFCCHLEVETTGDEAELLAKLVRSGKVVDRARVLAQAARSRQGAEWAERLAANRCVFLAADSSCGIYADRPSACRKLLVASPASECETAEGRPTPITIPMAELFISVALSLPGNGNVSLAKGLAAHLARTAGASEFPGTALTD